MKPGITILPRASMTAAPEARRSRPMAAIFLPSTSTSQFARSGTAGSIESTCPPRMM
jgi:hypothetical protein